ncbi:MAG TPA: hypothetical protein V6D26_04525 [Stenomitos sp.]
MITLLSACGTGPPEKTSTSTETPESEGVQKEVQRVIEQLPIGQPVPKGMVMYKGPIEQAIPVNSFLAGSDIEYVRLKDEKTAEVRIQGQRAFKQQGDSLEWKGSPVEGVNVQLRDRVLWFNPERLQLAGTIDLRVNEIAPKPGSIPKISDKSTSQLIVYKLPVIYRIKRGETISGTTLTYVGKTEKGAELSGLLKDEYPYREVGDSIAWQGQLRSKVYLDLVARTVFYNEDSLNLTGVATIILVPGK